jgi:hypothetical protein
VSPPAAHSFAMPMQWTISHPTRLVMAVAEDDLVLKDIEDYLDATLAVADRPVRIFRELQAACKWLDEPAVAG